MIGSKSPIKTFEKQSKNSQAWRDVKKSLEMKRKLVISKNVLRGILAIPVKSAKAVASVKQIDIEKTDPREWRSHKRKMAINHEMSMFTKTFRDSFITFIASALGLVAGLTWNDAIKSTIEKLFPTGADLVYKYYVAVVVTVIAVLITYFISKIKRN
jgi:hypothetical protein